MSEELIRRMCHVLQHRGPDEDGVYIAHHVGLGHRRLSIIDLAAGQQPMSNARQDLWITYNGEIYNFPTLRENLESKGYAFRTTCDTEVIIHLYDEYGTSCVQHLRGMFAFAIWDARRQRLFLARDRTGQKPLFYLLTHNSIAFASEIKALLQDATYKPEVNLTALYHYLSYQYVPPPETMFHQISKLPPAHILVCEKGSVKVEQYWDLHYTPKMQKNEHELMEELTDVFQEAVKMRMISDVPIGAFLSGGIDSSLVTAIMAEYSERPVKTFSIGFQEKEFNELPYARIVAERYQTEHHEFIVAPNAIEILPKLIWHFDEPFGDSSAIPTYYLSDMTSQYVKVALNGDGGDESFAGYKRYLGHKPAQYYQRIPYPLRRVTAPVLDLLSRGHGQGYVSAFIRRVKLLSDLSFESKKFLYARKLTIFHDPLKSELLTDDIRQQFQHLISQDYTYQYFCSKNVEHFTDRMLYADVMTYLPGDLLVKVDRTTMAFGLEGRSPFLDHKLMECAARLPAEFKLRKACLKYLLKQIGKTWLSENILTRKKQGFGVPIGQWFKHELREMLHDTFSSSHLVRNGILQEAAIWRILHEHQTGKIPHTHRIWVLLNLELWYRMFISNG